MNLDNDTLESLGFGSHYSSIVELAYRRTLRDWKEVYRERLWYFRSEPVRARHREIAREWYRKNKSKQAKRRKYAREWYRKNKAKASSQGELPFENLRSRD